MGRGKLILDLCGGTGSWSRPYTESGYRVLVVDPAFGDRLDVLTFSPPEKVHGILAAPPCTHFAGSGAQWWKGHDRAGLTEKSVEIVRACLRIIREARPKWWALENPVGRIERLVPELKPEKRPHRKWTFQPCDFGDAFTKKTCIWGIFNPPNEHKNPVEPEFYTTFGGVRLPPNWKLGGTSVKTKRIRSETPSGFANAFFLSNP